jgi:hypothetical protein
VGIPSQISSAMLGAGVLTLSIQPSGFAARSGQPRRLSVHRQNPTGDAFLDFPVNEDYSPTVSGKPVSTLSIGPRARIQRRARTFSL